MKNADAKNSQIEAERNRFSRLSEASRRINESLEFDTVLQEILDGARSLTDAPCGVITTLDASGQVEDFLASGMTADESRQLWEMPAGLEFFKYLSTIPNPLRVRDFAGHTRSLGLPEFQPPLLDLRAFLMASIRHQGEVVGNIFLAHKGPREFTLQDEKTLVMFASQASVVIANARRYRDEQRARADLETLIDISPVGVAVFDARTGRPVSFNREVRRMLDVLRAPGHPLEQILDVLTIRRGDGHTISLAEFPLAQALSTVETIRAEEIVLQSPNGRSVTTLVNISPIRPASGAVESVVVTLQDLTPLEELGRLRAELLGVVSHELRVPLSSIRGSATALLEALTDLDPAELRQFLQIIVEQADHMRELINDLLDVARIKTGTLPISPQPQEIVTLVDRARSTFQSGGGRKNLELELAPDLPLVMADGPRIVQVLGNLLSNADKHSLESSVIRVTAALEKLHVAVTVADEGKGVPADQVPHLFRKFSGDGDGDGTGATGGSGLGLAICKGIVEAHGGRIWAESEGVGLGARFTFTIPVAENPGRGADTRSYRAAPPRRKAREDIRILVVDDDPQALMYIRNTLSEEGFTTMVTPDSKDALALAENHKPHLVLLDLVLPDSDGIDLMNDLLRIADVPIIFVSAYGKDQIIAQAFERGATDYIVKPFSPTELVARVRAALRRMSNSHRSEPLEPYVLGDLRIDYDERRVTVAGREVRLTAGEYSLLYELSVEAGRVLTHDQLLRRIWSLRNSGDVRVLRTLVKRLRRKLDDDAGSPTYIFAEPRVGYRMPKGQEQKKG